MVPYVNAFKHYFVKFYKRMRIPLKLKCEQQTGEIHYFTNGITQCQIIKKTGPLGFLIFWFLTLYFVNTSCYDIKIFFYVEFYGHFILKIDFWFLVRNQCFLLFKCIQCFYIWRKKNNVFTFKLEFIFKSIENLNIETYFYVTHHLLSQ